MPTEKRHYMEVRTSQTHPLRIATLSVGKSGGAIGITFAPGKHQAAAMTGIWARDLASDLAAIRTWGASDLITLLEPHEFEELQITQLAAVTGEFGIRWHGLSITDGSPPDERFLGPWKKMSSALILRVLEGHRVVVHCKGGLGRAGTVASLLLMDSGAARTADQAMQMVREVRPGAIETQEQEAFLREPLIYS
jgi:protein-tyrosine phosphatase